MAWDQSNLFNYLLSTSSTYYSCWIELCYIAYSWAHLHVIHAIRIPSKTQIKRSKEHSNMVINLPDQTWRHVQDHLQLVIESHHNLKTQPVFPLLHPSSPGRSLALKDAPSEKKKTYKWDSRYKKMGIQKTSCLFCFVINAMTNNSVIPHTWDGAIVLLKGSAQLTNFSTYPLLC